jgi:hypothetical protein
MLCLMNEIQRRKEGLMRRVRYWGWLLCLLLTACRTPQQALPTIMALPLQSQPTLLAQAQPSETKPPLLTIAPTQERTRSAIVLSPTLTPSSTPTQLPLLPSLTPTDANLQDSFSLTLAALTAAPATTAGSPRCVETLCLPMTDITPARVANSSTEVSDVTAEAEPCTGDLCEENTSTVTPTIPRVTISLSTPGTEAAVEMPPTETATATPTIAAWYTQNHVLVEKPATLYEGPGITYLAVGVLNADSDARIVERNRIGNWVHVRQTDNGETLLDGWVMIGALTLEADLRFSQVPVNESLPDANMMQVRLQTTAPLYAAPVIPYISESMRDVYLRGQRYGVNSQSVTKIGDSVSANPLYLDLLSHDDAVLGPYDYLADTLRYFGPSRKQQSVAAKKGMSSFSIFDPLMASEVCKPDEAPLDCELRLQKPAVAFIMFGPNDIRAMEVDEYKVQMSMLVEKLIDNGTIPVLTTFSTDPARRTWQKSVTFNLALIEVARTYDVPLMNLWLASRDLPKYGLEGDGIHMRNFGYTYLKLDAGLESRFGVSLQNLLALRTLEELRNTVMGP